MRELVLKMQLSLDGFVGRPDGDIGWVFETFDPEATAWIVRSVSEASLHIMGSKTFGDMARFWPTSREVFAPPMNSIPKAVFSKRGRAVLDAVDRSQPNAESWVAAEVIEGDLADGIRRLKAADGKPIIAHGGATFARSLIATGLIDRFELMVHPVALGAGLPVFSGLRVPLKLALIGSTRFPGGTVGQVYRPVS